MMPAKGYLGRPVYRVSIVMPTYNRGYCLADTIQSVLGQTYKRWELLVVDNMSKDDTKEIVEGFGDARIKFMQIQNNGVIAVSRNCGIAAASGEFISFMDSDDPWLPDKLESSIRHLDLGYDVVYHDLYLTDGVSRRKDRITGVSRRLKTPPIQDLVKNGNGITTSSVVAKTELVRMVDGFSESPELIGIEDYDLWVRIACITERFGFIRSPLGYYTVNGNGTLNKSLVERGLLGIVRHHRKIHEDICGGTPGWIDVALARILLNTDPAHSLRMASGVLMEKNQITVRIKAIALVILTIAAIVRKKLRIRIKGEAS